MTRWLLCAIPLVIGFALTVIALLLGDARELAVSFSLAWIWLGAGCAASLLIAAGFLSAHSRRRAVARAHARGSTEQRDHQARFLSRLDHELKNPLTAIRAGVSNLDATTPGVATIDAQSARLARLTTDLRKLAEVRSVELEFDTIALDDLAAEVQDAARELPEARERSLVLVFPRAPRPLPAIRGDYDLLFLALHNLVTNAVKYSSPGDTVEVRGSEDDGWVTLEVADTGRGIPSDEHDHVWEELARGRETLDVGGTGLGLPFVRAIVERHGGSVALRSRPDEGTLVRVRLPIG